MLTTTRARVRAGIVAAVAAAACTAAAFTMQPSASAAPAWPSGMQVHRNVIFLPKLHRFDSPMTTAQCQAQFQIDCYTPAQVQHAYHLDSLYAKHVDGRGRTIVVIDEFGSPTIDGDLAAFDGQAGLPRAALKVIQPVGSVSGFDSTDANQVGWAGETTLDVEWAHVVAPGAKIVLMEVPDATGLVAGLKYAIDHRLGDVVSLSWGGVEQGGDTQALRDADGLLFKPAARAHITVVDASGDVGASGVKNDGSFYTFPVVDWPGTDPNVTAVGGSTLHLDGNGNRTSADTVWNDTYNRAANNLLYGNDGPSPIATGGGKSVVFGWPSYQGRVGGVTSWRRGIPDISMSGACTGAVNVYSTFGGTPSGWNEVCGTSESAPLFSGIVALADQEAGHALGAINPALYQIAAAHLPGIVPITSGNNTVTFTQDGTSQQVNGYSARNGYSMGVGVGTIDARYLVPELAHPKSAHHKRTH